MSAVIVIEIVIGIVVLAAAIRFAVRDTRQRESSRESEVEPVNTAQAPARSRESREEVAQPLSEVGSAEKS